MLEEKLKLWSNPAFLLFVQDLIDVKGQECDPTEVINSIRRVYYHKLKQLAPKSKWVQKELF